MKRYLFAALAACFLTLPALEAGAQYGDEPEPRLAFKFGVHSPSGSKFRDSKSLWRSMGAEYALSLNEIDRPTLVASAVFISSDNNMVDASMIGLLCEKRWYANPAEGSSLYYGAGLGYYIMEAKDRDFQWMQPVKRSGGKLGMAASVGYQYKGSYFGELRYNYSGELSNGLDMSGLSVNLGMRVAF